MDASGLIDIAKRRVPAPVRRLYHAFHFRERPLRRTGRFTKPLRGGRGIEIGGPSALFRDTVPVYRVIEGLDGVNFSHETMWEGKLQDGGAFHYAEGCSGTQYVMEASDLSALPSHRYDFLLSSNCLEHVANPIKALKDWQRVVVPGGRLLLALPRKSSNFDHRRPTTPLTHLIEDYENDTTEHDLTHLDEILALHDLSRDPPAGDLASFKQRSLDNFRNRGLHHHVFDVALIEQLFDHLGIRLEHVASTTTDHIAIGRTG